MKIKTFTLLLFCFSLLGTLKSQNANTSTTYRIEIKGVSETNFQQVANLLSKYAAATDIAHNAEFTFFTFNTEKELDAAVVAGKLQKNYFPVGMLQKTGALDSTFPKMKTTGNSEQDAINYENEKSQWIKENPEAYQQMLKNPSSASTPKN